MSPLLVPLFAQLVALQLSDRTEARYVKYDRDYFEGSTAPSALFTLSERRTSFSLGYGPTLQFAPGEAPGSRLAVFHQGAAQVAYQLPRTTFSLGSSLSIGDVNFRLAGLQGLTSNRPNADQTPDGGATPDGNDSGTDGGANSPPDGNTGSSPPGTPNPNAPSGQTEIEDRMVRYYSSNTSLAVAHRLSKEAQVSAQLGHARAGGLDPTSRFFYPVTTGWVVSTTGTYMYRYDARNTFASNASLAQTWSSDRNRAATLNASETWSHNFSKRTSSSLGAGLNITRFVQPGGLEGFSIFPTFQAAFAHTLRLARGTLSLGVSAYSAPALDPLRALVDPRIGVGANVTYSRKRFAVGVTASGALSIAPDDNDRGAVNSSQGEARVSYQLATLVQVDGGARYVHQNYQGQNVIPPSWACFAGFTFGYQLSNSTKR